MEKGTHWVDAALNAHKGTNLLAMALPPVPEVPPPELPTTFPEIACPLEAIFSTDTFIHGQPCPPRPIQGWPQDATQSPQPTSSWPERPSEWRYLAAAL